MTNALKICQIKFNKLIFLTNDQFNQLYKIHKSSLPNDLLHHFGIDSEKNYFKEILDKKKGKIIVAEYDNNILGYLVLKVKEVSMYKLLTLKSIFLFLFRALFKPSLLVRLIFQIFYPIDKPHNLGEIDYFVVQQGYRSAGIGVKLIEYAEKIAKENKIENIYTKTYNKQLSEYYIKKKGGVISSKFRILDYIYFCIYWKIN